MTGERSKLSLDRQHRFIGGVCAGFARYLDMPIWVVRLLTLFAAFTFALTIVVYIVLYFVLDAGPESVTRPQRRSTLINRLRGFEWQRPLYKNKRRGKIQGVCTGIADYLQINPLIVRLLLLASLFFGPLGILLYVGAAVVMEDRSAPAAPVTVETFDNADSKERKSDAYRFSQQEFTSGPAGNDKDTPRGQGKNTAGQDAVSIDEIAGRFEMLEQRLRQIEATTTSRKFRLQRELKRMAAS